MQNYLKESELYGRADIAGRNAAQACVPTPMHIVGYEPIADGLCGFAWINIKPATSRFCKYLKSAGIGRTDSCYGGRSIWVNEYDQSHARKTAYAHAFAQVLRDAGIKAYGMDRLD